MPPSMPAPTAPRWRSRPALTKDVPAATLAIYEPRVEARGNAVVPLEQDFCPLPERLTRNDCLAILNSVRMVKSCSIFCTPRRSRGVPDPSA
jgi:hypothetical protein